MRAPVQAAKYTALLKPGFGLALIAAALVSIWWVGTLGRGYWTPDEPREADLAWRMSWQSSKAVPLLAGEPFCEKPPLTYWLAGASIGLFGASAWAARLPNVLYALIGALSVGLLARRSAGASAGLIAAAAISTFLLSYQVAIWLATDAPLLAAVAVALLGSYQGFYARERGERLRGYLLMHTALALGFLSKSAVAWMVPALALGTLVIWERRWRELVRFELYVGLVVQAVIIGAWVLSVYQEPDGASHLKILFWNNLAGRFIHIDAPAPLQYASAHRNTPGKYFIELPVYLWPWTLLVLAALRRAVIERHAPFAALRPVRFALASSLPALVLLSFAATARNIYLAPALPGLALLLGWWGRETLARSDRWDRNAVRGTAWLLVIAALAFAAALALVGTDAGEAPRARGAVAVVGGLGVLAAAALALHADAAARRGALLPAQFSLLLAYCVLLALPAAAIYREVDTWQDLGRIGRAIESDARGRPLILMAPDETTRAFIDMYARTTVALIPGSVDRDTLVQLRDALEREPSACVVAQLPGRNLTPAWRELGRRFGLRLAGERQAVDEPPWAPASHLRLAHLYALPNGRRYALLERVI